MALTPNIGPRLDIRQQQTLVMTPQLQQAIRLLALTNLEVEAFLTAEIERNPLLETADGEDSGPERAEALAPDDAGGEGDGDGDPSEPLTTDAILARDAEPDGAPLDIEADSFTHDCAADVGSRAGEPVSEGEFDSVAGPAPTLVDVLMEQAGRVLSGADLAIAGVLIDAIDDAGYLTEPLDDVAARLAVPVADVERVLVVIHSFEPTGVGARSLAECLALQAREADRLDPAMQSLLANLTLVARGDLAAIRRVCGVSAEDVSDMLRELRAYNPKPGLLYGSAAATAVVPDVFVRRARGGWAVELNNGTLPRLIVDRAYQERLGAAARSKTDRTFLNECAASANWLVRALDQRARTIVKVTSEIVRRQEGFFNAGVHSLKPLTLRAIADEIGMHESTVSRVTSNKYLACERGTFELKWFFHAGITTADGEDASAEAVRARLRVLVQTEPPHAPLSDDKLMELLNAEGFGLARRTVAKYREALGFGSSIQRRRQRLIQAA